MYLAFQNLKQDKSRFILSVLSVSLAIMLILILQGFLAGFYNQIATYINHSPGSLILTQHGVSSMLGATSIIPTGTLEEVKSMKGVQAVVPILSQFVILDLHEKKQPVYLIGYVKDLGGGPWKLASGGEPRGEFDIVFDQVLAQRHHLKIGDRLSLMGRTFTIVGLSQETTSWMTSFLFIQKSTAEKLLRVPNIDSFLLITPVKDAPVERLKSRLGDLPGIDAWLKPELAANDLKLFANVFSTPLRLMVGIAFLVGTLVVGLVIYTATIERQREYGVLKAVGASNQRLYSIVLWQALIISLLGVALGGVLAYGAAQWIMAMRPQFLILITPFNAARAVLAGSGISLLAALAPVRVLAGLAPAEVFRK